MADDRRRLRSLYDEKSLMDPFLYDEAFHALITPARRLAAELFWFPGSVEAEVRFALSYLKDSKRTGAMLTVNIPRLKSPAACIGELNLLISLLPYVKDAELDSVFFEACRLFDGIDRVQLRTVIDESRKESSMPVITRLSDFEDSFLSYQNDVCSTLAKRLQKSNPYDFDQVLYRLSSLGSSPIVDAVMRDYEYSISGRLEQYEASVQSSIKELERFFNKDERPALIENIRQMVNGWDSAIEPLRRHCGAVGTDAAIRDHENRMISDILCSGYDSLASQGSDIDQVRLSLGHLILQITPDRDKYANLRALLKLQTAEIEMAEFRRQQAAAEKNRRLAEKAWRNEQQRNDSENRKRAEKAAAQERKRNARIEDAEIASYRARYKKMKDAEEFAAKEAQRKYNAELIASKTREHQRVVASLEAERGRLTTELSNLKGLFSGKRRRQIEARLTQISTELSDSKTTVCSRLRKARIKRNLTQQQLAYAVGKTAVQINRIETGADVPDVQTMLAIVRALDCSADELF